MRLHGTLMPPRLSTNREATARPPTTTTVQRSTCVRATPMRPTALPPMRKYPAALRAYRRVLELDKNNQKAKANVTQIEDVYKQMGRPIPQ